MVASRMVAAAISILSLNACYTWRADNNALNGSHSSRDQFEVWAQDKSRPVHGLRVNGDTVSGVPFTLPANCDSCRIRWLRSDIDSVRARHENPLGSTLLILSAAALVWLYFSVRAGIGST